MGCVCEDVENARLLRSVNLRLWVHLPAPFLCTTHVTRGQEAHLDLNALGKPVFTVRKVGVSVGSG